MEDSRPDPDDSALLDDDLYANDSVDFDDSFGTARVGEEVAAVTLQAATPFTLGVVGKWGAGKTSVLRRAFGTLGGQGVQLEVPFTDKPREEEGWNQLSFDFDSRVKALGWHDTLLTRRDRSLVVWYSPWQHQNADNPLLPLLLEIRRQFSTAAKLKNVARQGLLAGATLLERAIDGALSLKGIRGKVASGTTEALLHGSSDTRLDDGQRFHLLFGDAVETVLRSLASVPNEDTPGLAEPTQKDLGRLVIFVDDLDRCEESAVVQLLEAIKLYLGAPGCVFVLGLDEAAVLSALGRHWPGRSMDDNREYLEKLFQATVPVPAPAAPKVRDWVCCRLERHGFQSFEICADLLLDILEPNPRKIKNFVNSAGAVWSFMQGHRPDEPKDALTFEKRFMLVQYIRLYHKPIWRLLERDPRVLMIVTSVLLGGEVPEVDEHLESDFKPFEQRLLGRFVFRSFLHVLDQMADEPSQEKDDKTLHGFIDLNEAVELFAGRIDRKRSDQRFRHHYGQLFRPGEALPDAFLALPEQSTTPEDQA